LSIKNLHYIPLKPLQAADFSLYLLKPFASKHFSDLVNSIQQLLKIIKLLKSFAPKDFNLLKRFVKTEKIFC
jgi:hypothetical protein